VATFGATFLGYDPRNGLPVQQACPRIQTCATVVWFEKWGFTGWTKGDVSDTGIVYQKHWHAFDMLGNQIEAPCPGVMSGCGFSGNETCTKTQHCKDDDEWLSFARDRCNAGALPPPGAIFYAPGFADYIGR
jgi:hypothetical protein